MEGDVFLVRALIWMGLLGFAIIALLLLPDKWDPAMWFKEWLEGTDDEERPITIRGEAQRGNSGSEHDPEDRT